MLPSLSNRMEPHFAALSSPSTRSPAQIRASQENGRLSRGPATEQGKLASRKNALKHGLRAMVVRLPSDVRGDDRRYRLIRRQLIKELEPATFTEHAAVDGLAHDFLQLTRARQMIEVLMRPKPLPAKEQSRWKLLEEDRRTVRLIGTVAKALAAGDRSGCSLARHPPHAFVSSRRAPAQA